MNKLDSAGFRLVTFITTLVYMTSPLLPTSRLWPKRKNSVSPGMPGRPKVLISRGSYGAGFKYLEDIEKIFEKGYTDADERMIRMLQAEVRIATGKRKDAEKSSKI